MLIDRLGLWPARAVWLVAPVVAGTGLGRLLDDRPTGPAVAVEVALWAIWFGVLVATLAPSPRSLTACRIVAPALVGVAVLAVLSAGADRATLAATGWSGLFVALVLMPVFGDRMINGSAYGSERRMALRPQAFVLLGPLQVAWLGVFAGLVVPAALLLQARYPAAAVAAVVAAPVIWAGTRILHQLAGRWIVFVPAGFVLRDPMTLVDAVLFARRRVAAVGPALDDGAGDRADLTGGALGLAVEVALTEPVPITVRERGEARQLDVTNVVFTPSLPGAMLAEARIRGLKIGSPSAA